MGRLRMCTSSAVGPAEVSVFYWCISLHVLPLTEQADILTLQFLPPSSAPPNLTPASTPTHLHALQAHADHKDVVDEFTGACLEQVQQKPTTNKEAYAESSVKKSDVCAAFAYFVAHKLGDSVPNMPALVGNLVAQTMPDVRRSSSRLLGLRFSRVVWMTSGPCYVRRIDNKASTDGGGRVGDTKDTAPAPPPLPVVAVDACRGKGTGTATSTSSSSDRKPRAAVSITNDSITNDTCTATSRRSSSSNDKISTSNTVAATTSRGGNSSSSRNSRPVKRQRQQPTHPSVFLRNHTDVAITPRWVVSLCQDYLGPIDLDPATSTFINSLYIFAKWIFTEAEDGLQQQWAGRTVFCNPPWSATSDWVRHAVDQFRSGKVETMLLLLKADPSTRAFTALAGERAVFATFKARVTFEEMVEREGRPACRQHRAPHPAPCMLVLMSRSATNRKRFPYAVRNACTVWRMAEKKTH